MKNIVIYLDNPGIYDYPFDVQRYIESYSDLCFELDNNGFNAFIARGPLSYGGNSKFNHVYKFNNQRKLIEYGTIRADVVFDKGERSTFPQDGIIKINNIKIDNICNDKNLTSSLFSTLVPRSIQVNSINELKNALKQMSTDIKVFKPVVGFGGEGIIISKSSEIIDEISKLGSAPFPAIIQEFIDTSSGIPGLTDTYHDLRIIMINNKVMQASLRTPPVGSLLANIKQGGNIKSINVNNLPKSAIDIALMVDEELQKYGSRIYSVDMLFDGSEFKLLELNSRPGWHPISEGKEAEKFIIELSRLLMKAIR